MDDEWKLRNNVPIEVAEPVEVEETPRKKRSPKKTGRKLAKA